MKKTIFILVLAAFSLTLSSCLKDKPNTDFSGIGTVVELPYAGLQYFSRDAVTASGDTVTMAFGVNIASAKPLSTATNYSIAVDYSLMNAYNAANTNIVYEQMPTGSYKITDLKGNAVKLSGTIPAGARLDSVLVTVYKTLLDPAKSYMLPIKLASASNGIVSGNFNAHYYHFIGNPFAGSYTWSLSRYNDFSTPPPPGTPVSGGSFSGAQVTIYPVSPTQFEVTTGYYSQPRYEVTFSHPDATHYSNFQISFNADDIAASFPGAGITVTQQPVFGYGVTPAYDPNALYTYQEALKYFTFQYVVTTGHFRFLVDTYVHN